MNKITVVGAAALAVVLVGAGALVIRQQQRERRFRAEYGAAQAAVEAQQWSRAIDHLGLALQLRADEPAAALLDRAQRESAFAARAGAAAELARKEAWADARAAWQAAQAILPDGSKQEFAMRCPQELAFAAAMAEASAAADRQEWPAAIEKARLALAAKDDPAARKLLQQAQGGEALGRARAAVAAGRWSDAVDGFSAALAAKPDDAVRAELEHASNEVKRAALLEEAKRAIEQGQRKPALTAAKAAQALRPGRDVETLLAQASQLSVEATVGGRKISYRYRDKLRLSGVEFVSNITQIRLPGIPEQVLARVPSKGPNGWVEVGPGVFHILMFEGGIDPPTRGRTASGKEFNPGILMAENWCEVIVPIECCPCELELPGLGWIAVD